IQAATSATFLFFLFSLQEKCASRFIFFSRKVCVCLRCRRDRLRRCFFNDGYGYKIAGTPRTPHFLSYAASNQWVASQTLQCGNVTSDSPLPPAQHCFNSVFARSSHGRKVISCGTRFCRV